MHLINDDDHGLDDDGWGGALDRYSDCSDPLVLQSNVHCQKRLLSLLLGTGISCGSFMMTIMVSTTIVGKVLLIATQIIVMLTNNR